MKPSVTWEHVVTEVTKVLNNYNKQKYEQNKQ